MASRSGRSPFQLTMEPVAGVSEVTVAVFAFDFFEACFAACAPLAGEPAACVLVAGAAAASCACAFATNPALAKASAAATAITPIRFSFTHSSSEIRFAGTQPDYAHRRGMPSQTHFARRR